MALNISDSSILSNCCLDWQSAKREFVGSRMWAAFYLAPTRIVMTMGWLVRTGCREAVGLHNWTTYTFSSAHGCWKFYSSPAEIVYDVGVGKPWSHDDLGCNRILLWTQIRLYDFQLTLTSVMRSYTDFEHWYLRTGSKKIREMIKKHLNNMGNRCTVLYRQIPHPCNHKHNATIINSL